MSADYDAWCTRYEEIGYRTVERPAPEAPPPGRIVLRADDEFEPPLATLRCLSGGAHRRPSVRWVHSGDDALEAELAPLARSALSGAGPALGHASAVLAVVIGADRRPTVCAGPNGAPSDGLVPPSVLVEAAFAFLDGPATATEAWKTSSGHARADVSNVAEVLDLLDEPDSPTR